MSRATTKVIGRRGGAAQDNPVAALPKAAVRPVGAPPLRVLHVIPYGIAGGVESFIRTLALFMPGVEHSVVALTLNHWGPSMFAGSAPLWHPQLALAPEGERAAEWLRQFLGAHPEFDVLHLAYSRNLYRVARVDGRPVVCTVHSDGYGWLAKEKWPERLFCVSHSLSHWFESNLTRRLSPDVIVNGVDTHALAAPRRRRTEVIGDRPYILWVGRWHPTKGTAVLERAWQAIQQDVPDAWLHVVGSGMSAAPSATQFQQFISPGAMPQVYANADLLLHTSPFEGFGLVVAEAQAAGLPVVARNVCGVQDIVVPGETGFLVPDGADDEETAERLAQAVIHALGPGRKKLKAMGRAAAKRAKQEFSAERMAAEYEAAYRGLVE